MPLNFDMDALRSMVVGVELGSFARAASRLGRSQSAVSMQLKKLEQQAGCRLFHRSGRALLPTEAGERLLAYARQIIALNDEIASGLGSIAAVPTVRLGLPQDYFDDVLSDALTRFAEICRHVHVDVRAGRNYALEEDIRNNRLDLALAYCEPRSQARGERLLTLPLQWLAAMRQPPADQAIPLVLYDHPCLFRQAALRSLDARGLPWRMALTTPSLPGVWTALLAGHGISVRTPHRVAAGVRDVGDEFCLPRLGSIEMRLFSADTLSTAALQLKGILIDVVCGKTSTAAEPARQATARGRTAS